MKDRVLAAVIGACVFGAGLGTPAVAQTAAPVAQPADTDAPVPGGGMRRGGLMRADANGDGVVTREEVIADADRRFAALDTDRNGTVSRDEMQAARSARRMRRDDERSADPAARAAPTGEAARRGDTRAPMTREAMRDRALRRFDRVDANHDGRVDAQEMGAMRLLMRARMSGADGQRSAPAPDEQQ